MKKIFLIFFQSLLILLLLIGCSSNKDSQTDNSTPSQTENATQSNKENEITSIPELPFAGNPIELPEDILEY